MTPAELKKVQPLVRLATRLEAEISQIDSILRSIRRYKSKKREKETGDKVLRFKLSICPVTERDPNGYKHTTLYTDINLGADLDALVAVFTAARDRAKADLAAIEL